VRQRASRRRCVAGEAPSTGVHPPPCWLGSCRFLSACRKRVWSAHPSLAHASCCRRGLRPPLACPVPCAFQTCTNLCAAGRYGNSAGATTSACAGPCSAGCVERAKGSCVGVTSLASPRPERVAALVAATAHTAVPWCCPKRALTTCVLCVLSPRCTPLPVPPPPAPSLSDTLAPPGPRPPPSLPVGQAPTLHPALPRARPVSLVVLATVRGAGCQGVGPAVPLSWSCFPPLPPRVVTSSCAACFRLRACACASVLNLSRHCRVVPGRVRPGTVR
jgi:hypothetical protein